MAGESAREVAKRSREKAERLMRHAELYERGAIGEETTAALLRALPPGWSAFHDVRWPGRRLANIDHIVVGPGGIFVIDSKNWSGRIEVAGQTLRQNGRSRETAVAGCADSAIAVAELVPTLAKCVVPVLCFVREQPVQGWARDVMVCSSGNLLKMLVTRPTRMSPDQVRDASWQLDALLREARRRGPSVQQPALRAPAARPARTRARSTCVRRGKKDSSMVRLLVALVMILGFVAFGPRLASAFSTVFVHAMTKGLTPSACPSGSADPSGSKQSRKRQTQSHGRQGPSSGGSGLSTSPETSC